MPVTECIAVYIRLSSEDNDVDGSIKAESNSVSAQRMLINEFIKKQDEFINCSVVEYVDAPDIIGLKQNPTKRASL